MSRKEDVYDEQISPLMTKVIEICKEHDIGAVMAFELDNDGTEEDPDYLHCTTSLPGAGDERLQRVAAAAAPRRSSPQMFSVTVETGDGTKEIHHHAILD